ncbi:MAG: phosphoserine phosphatase SerB [Actinomycetota bacterium]
MTKFLVVFDVDSTLIEDEAIELLADYAGTRAQVSEITDRAMRGELDFSQSLRERVATLAGLDEKILGEVAAALRPTQGAKQLVDEIRIRGGKSAAVSGGFIQLLDPVKAEIGFDFSHANTLEVSSGKLTGKVSGEIVDREVKARMLRTWATELNLPLEKTIAVGDGANDLGMMEIAGLSIAFDAKPLVRQKAKVSLNQRDLAQIISLLP